MPLPRSLPQSAKNGERRNESTRVLARRYKVERRLGSGSFGTAYLVLDLQSSDNERKVMKQIEVGDLLPDETVGAVKEAQLLAKLDHPTIVKFHESFLENDQFCIITELCEGGDLDQLINHQREDSGCGFEETLIIDWFIQLTAAVMYIHNRRILHRDIKTRNIFLKKNLIKLGDFGISRILLGTTEMASTFTGTPHYMSPEALKQCGYNSKSDIWSLGVVLYEMCTLQRAFPGSNLLAVMYRIVEGDKPVLPVEQFSSDLIQLLGRILDKEPQKRPSAHAVLQEPFLLQRMKTLQERLVVQLIPPDSSYTEHSSSSSSLSSSSSSHSRIEAQAIANALTPVKKRSLQTTPTTTGTSSLTPRQRLVLRKKEQADRQAVERRRLAAENFSQGKKRFTEHKKKEGKVVPPWIGEHPDVFNDPNFSLTQMETRDYLTTLSSLPSQQQQQDDKQQQSKDDGEGKATGERERESEKAGDTNKEEKEEGKEEGEDEYDDDFEEISSSEDEYEALMECIEEVLDLPNQPIPDSPQPSDHEDLCPFSSQAREKKIHYLKSQCQAIYGEEVYEKIYGYLKEVRSRSVPHEDEAGVLAGLRRFSSNTRDCFLVDQLVFLEKQL